MNSLLTDPANHPANGPLPVQRIERVIEALESSLKYRNGSSMGNVLADAVKGLRELLVSREAKGELEKYYGGVEYADMVNKTFQPNITQVADLYAVTVPGGRSVTYTDSASDAADCVKRGWSVQEYVELERYQEAMIGNSPASPDGWIPVSDRLPEEIGRYWCYVEEQNSLGKSHYQWNCAWNGERWWVECENGGRVTHWMELPAAPNFRENVNSSTKYFREYPETSTNSAVRCWCRTCRPVTMNDMRFVVFPECGNKRCPHANDHNNTCTGSNEPGQAGSAYPAAPKEVG